ncbi:MAG: DUF3108 domain-containing protein [Syntrophales bacterium]|nr:DUF3108 domain-containing protein [Syntrophales bacterium]
MFKRKQANLSDHRVRKTCLIVLLSFLSCVGFDDINANALGWAKEFPFAVGEKLTYRARLGPIAVGTTTISVRPSNLSKAPDTYHFIMETRTSSRINWFYRINETQESWVDGKMSRSLAYRKRDTGTHVRDVVVRFDWQTMRASYRNAGKDEKTSSLLPGTFDPLALFFVLRTKPLKVGDTVELPISNGKKLVRAIARVVKRETITINGKKHDTFLVVPDLGALNEALGGKDASDLMIWFSADAKRFPLKIASRFPIGSFVFEMVSAETGQS